MASQPSPHVSLKEYLAAEEACDGRHEYFGGEVFEMEAATIRHQQIQANLFGALLGVSKQQGCQTFASGPRVATSRAGLYTYPDPVIVCGALTAWDTDPDTVSNPKVIIEILSPSSKDYDRGTKFELYRKLPSLAEYLIVHQDAPFIEHHVKQRDGSWLTRDLEGIDGVLRLESLTATIPFATIFG